MTTDTTKTEREGPIEFDRNCGAAGIHRVQLACVFVGQDCQPTRADSRDLIACLSANPQLRAAVLAAMDPELESELAEARAALAETLQLAEERLNERNQLRADLDAEQSGRLATRARYGAREDETFGAFIQRLVTESIEAKSELAAERARVAAAEAMVDELTEVARMVLDQYGFGDCDAAPPHERNAISVLAGTLASRPAEQAKDSAPVVATVPAVASEVHVPTEATGSGDLPHDDETCHYADYCSGKCKEHGHQLRPPCPNRAPQVHSRATTRVTPAARTAAAPASPGSRQSGRQ